MKVAWHHSLIHRQYNMKQHIWKAPSINLYIRKSEWLWMVKMDNKSNEKVQFVLHYFSLKYIGDTELQSHWIVSLNQGFSPNSLKNLIRVKVLNPHISIRSPIITETNPLVLCWNNIVLYDLITWCYAKQTAGDNPQIEGFSPHQIILICSYSFW